MTTATDVVMTLDALNHISVTPVSQFEFDVTSAAGQRAPALHGLIFIRHHAPVKSATPPVTRIDPNAIWLNISLSKRGEDILHNRPLISIAER
jgi:hypothetical protein